MVSLGEGFVIKHERTNPQGVSGDCTACGEVINITDGLKYVRMQFRTKGEEINFHEDCFMYIFTGISKFHETFLEHRKAPIIN